MNPSSETGFNLPPPVTPEQLPPAENLASAPEQVAARAEQALSPTPTAAVATPPVPMPSTQAAIQPVVQQADASSTTNGIQSVPLDDGDLIEKEWVNKAKEIVERTRDNPYQQSEELTVFKAEYMKKRYNKTVKVNK